jgi:hypothetical protein
LALTTEGGAGSAATDRHPEFRVGDVLDRVFKLYKEHFGVLIPAAFLLSLVVSIRRGFVGPHDPGLSFIALAVSTAIGVLYQGIVVNLVREAHDGRRVSSLGGLFGAVVPALGPLLAAAILYGIAIAAGIFLLVLPACFLATIWAVIAPAIVIEKRGVIAAFRRSRELVRGFGRPVLGAILIVALIVLIGGCIRNGIALAIAGGPFLHPGGPLLRIVLDLLVSTVTGPLIGLLAAVLYYRLREAKGEGSSRSC